MIGKLSCRKESENVFFLLDELEMELGVRKAGGQRSEVKMIKRRCAWCGCDLGEKPVDGAAMKYGDTTDGICDDCLKTLYGDYKDYRARRSNLKADEIEYVYL